MLIYLSILILFEQTMRITELQSVIAELTRKLNAANDNKIIEEDEEEDEDVDDDDEDAQSRFTSDIENQGACNTHFFTTCPNFFLDESDLVE